ncbi:MULTISPECIES: Uma2 family endonuclease [unclassified Streptomyces]|uniref:Uma2 family endonuclease n=1 Tax=unclassified Streptomyces TaxID=2593676 RepID=UPI001CBEB514|nr:MULTISPECIES: Uma2 family endonuclease [unclassified Streptomyces]WPO72976.1 Uma2 family endonuclease [Streptomyces sp. KN37]
MTPGTDERPQMSVEEFEELARRAPETVSLEFLGGRVSVKHGPICVEDFEELARVAPETVTLELINGKLEVKPVPDGDHGEIIMWLLRQCMMQRPELALYPEQGLRIDTYRKGCIKPDGALAPVGYFAGQDEWASPEGVLMTVEVTSGDRDTERRDRQEKPRAYAYAGIPVYLLIDRDNDTVVVHSAPQNGVYQNRRPYHYGSTVRLPSPVAITLETEKLKDYVT